MHRLGYSPSVPSLFSGWPCSSNFGGDVMEGFRFPFRVCTNIHHDGVTRNRESYIARVDSDDNDRQRVRTIAAQAPAIAF